MRRPSPGIPSRPPHESDEAVRRAMLALHHERCNEAERIAREILSTAPDHRQAKRILGSALLMQGRAAETVALLEELVRAARDPELDTQLAVALRRIGRIDDALHRLKRAIKRRPPAAVAFHELGSQLYALGRLDEAISVVKEGIGLVPTMPELFVLLGNVYLATGDLSEAKAVLSRALSIASNHPDGHYAIAGILVTEREFAQAAHHLRAVLAVRPTDAVARHLLGKCLLELGELGAAMVCLRAASAAGPQFYGKALQALASAAQGRFWLRPSAAAAFFKGEKAPPPIGRPDKPE